jgi:hypothetical protein
VSNPAINLAFRFLIIEIPFLLPIRGWILPLESGRILLLIWGGHSCGGLVISFRFFVNYGWWSPCWALLLSLLQWSHLQPTESLTLSVFLFSILPAPFTSVRRVVTSRFVRGISTTTNFIGNRCPDVLKDTKVLWSFGTYSGGDKDTKVLWSLDSSSDVQRIRKSYDHSPHAPGGDKDTEVLWSFVRFLY